jgi:hypothetical protein
MAMKWLDECVRFDSMPDTFSRSHRRHHDDPAVDEWLPARLLDVSRDPVCLSITGGKSGKYFTLSHCWGGTMATVTTMENLESRTSGIPWEKLCTTFQDAIVFTRRLKCQYLWIDSLCIYSHRTTMTCFASLRNIPQDFEDFHYTHLTSQYI